MLDLGCGPGHTTRLLAESCAPRRLVGLDASERYVSSGRRLTADPRIEFRVHDVTRSPLPGAPVDAIYCRFLLSHLENAVGLVDAWRSQLCPGGRVVLDELETIDAPPGPLHDYLELSAQVVAREGGSLYAGPLLEGFGGGLVEVQVPSPTAARMFSMNLEALRGTALTHGLADGDGLDDLAARLDDLGEVRGTVRWLLRQVVIRP